MIELPNKKYSVIYADPPWTFKTYSKKGLKKSAQMHYDCMTLEDIKSLPVQQICNPDAVLLLWTTDPFLEKAMEVIDEWGFNYKTVGFYWAKENRKSEGWFKGTGYWTRANPEMCLLATRGKPKRVSKNVDKLVVSKRREHSRKPDEIYRMIEELVDGPYIELFSRTQRNQWDSWGNEQDKFKNGIS